mmetsp:Transcript_3176/g.7448  ORF Transcript_3176/g.7448 Transcript_3176/m.7448 type:complete len:307 (-) Transcript_3176:119-1039(-)|eukprot:CAMPEP_0178986108 /NCGR_PEP_ID=MMETSP0795-20121207/2521_1 /TAXON_ID=88552 /ORGANISM="Amoebophrya sp., Strain Ameob2" /LENGTH=306 /DNA_ID=CAMNT_0020677133 /DNA_START=111 /DNA_END=1031 /DNA_ORIENTATION=-
MSLAKEPDDPGSQHEYYRASPVSDAFARWIVNEVEIYLEVLKTEYDGRRNHRSIAQARAAAEPIEAIEHLLRWHRSCLRTAQEGYFCTTEPLEIRFWHMDEWTVQLKRERACAAFFPQKVFRRSEIKGTEFLEEWYPRDEFEFYKKPSHEDEKPVQLEKVENERKHSSGTATRARKPSQSPNEAWLSLVSGGSLEHMMGSGEGCAVLREISARLNKSQRVGVALMLLRVRSGSGTTSSSAGRELPVEVVQIIMSYLPKTAARFPVTGNRALTIFSEVFGSRYYASVALRAGTSSRDSCTTKRESSN